MHLFNNIKGKIILSKFIFRTFNLLAKISYKKALKIPSEIVKKFLSNFLFFKKKSNKIQKVNTKHKKINSNITKKSH
jgi:hypothetical protein